MSFLKAHVGFPKKLNNSFKYNRRSTFTDPLVCGGGDFSSLLIVLCLKGVLGLEPFFY